MNATLQQLATVDALTGLLNRRCMNELLQREIARFARTGRPFSVVLGDIDDFKVINDIYGHSAGDSALCAAADALREAVREGDHVGRWGGEEFVLLLPETDQKAAAVVAERVQERVRATVLENDGATIHIRMTLGVSMCLEGKSLDEMLVAADQALYDGKRKGKNCIVVAA